MRRILVVDDEPKILRLIAGYLEESGHSVARCGARLEAEALLEHEIFDLLITDVRLPDGSGVSLLEHARELCPSLEVILITAFGTIPEAVQAMKLGALDYLEKPFEMEVLGRLVARALESTALREEVSVLRADCHRVHGERPLCAESPAMKDVLALIRKVAPTPTTVLIQGESGTGKEVVAEAIHRLGLSRSRPLVRINCTAIPSELMESELFGHMRGAFTGARESRKGWFEIASGGTLLLDEISGLSLALQAKLLRVLEERSITRLGSGKPTPIDVRILAASNDDLKELCARGAFRDDLFYRLNVFPIYLPPLRDRREDIPPLVEILLRQIASRLGNRVPRAEPEVLEVLVGYDWPGNVRELRNILERAAILAGAEPIALGHLPAELFDRGLGGPSSSSFIEQVERFKENLLLEALRATRWVKKDAAERLGLSPRALSHYLGRYNLEARREGNGD
jgi:DNA-binding NtrC family response regulator